MPKPRNARVVAALAIAGLAALMMAAPAGAAPSLHLRSVGKFSEPVYATGAPGDRSRVFVVERAGRVRVVRGGRTLKAPFLDLRSEVSTVHTEQGMLSIAFAPDYAKSGRFYVDYTAQGDGAVHVREYRRATRDRADPRSGRDVLVIPHTDGGDHNGGQTAFGPDGLLYVGVGDAENSANAQRRDVLLGKIVRVNARVPGAAPQIWAMGLRNPWRFSFDAKTGDMAIGDEGDHTTEEIDFAPAGTRAGLNYGWPAFEGRRATGAGTLTGRAVPPVFTYDHGARACAVIAGYVVRDPALPALAGRFLYGDLCDPRITSLRLRRGGASRPRSTRVRVPGLVSFGQDAFRRLYAVSINGGVYRLVR